MGVFSRMDIEKDNDRESPSKQFRTNIANRANRAHRAKIEEEYKKYQQKYNKKVRKPIESKNYDDELSL